MSKIVFFNLPGASGHINPTVGLVDRLVKLGEDVIYYAGEDSRQKFTNLGAEFRNYSPWFEYHHNSEVAAELFPMALAELDMTVACTEGLIEQLKQDKPDYIIYDSCCVWGKYVAEALGIPGINSITTLVSTPYILLSDWRLSSHILKELLSHIGIVFYGRRQIRQLFKKIGVEYRNIFYHIFDFFANVGDLNIVFNTEQYQPFVSTLKGDFRFVGASVPEGRDLVSAEFQNIHENPLVYISLGTLHNTDITFFKMCVEAFADKPFDVIISVGSQERVTALGDLPDNVCAYEFVPQLHVLKYASVFVSHGGMNSLNEGLYFGVPMLVCPQQFEQAFNGRRFEKMDMVKVLPDKDIEPEDFYRLVLEIQLNKNMRENAQAYSEVLKGSGGVEAAADIIYRYMHPSQTPTSEYGEAKAVGSQISSE